MLGTGCWALSWLLELHTACRRHAVSLVERGSLSRAAACHILLSSWSLLYSHAKLLQCDQEAWFAPDKAAVGPAARAFHAATAIGRKM